MKQWLPPALFITILLFISFGSNLYTDYGIVKMDKKLETQVFDPYDEDILLLFFGYAGCINVCTPRMQEIAAIYANIKDKNIGLVFVNLIESQDREIAQEFASAFHEDYKVLELSKRELYELKNEFNIYSAPSLSSKTDLDHTAFLFLLKKENGSFYLKRIYTNTPLIKELIVKDIRKI